MDLSSLWPTPPSHGRPQNSECDDCRRGAPAAAIPQRTMQGAALSGQACFSVRVIFLTPSSPNRRAGASLHENRRLRDPKFWASKLGMEDNGTCTREKRLACRAYSVPRQITRGLSRHRPWQATRGCKKIRRSWVRAFQISQMYSQVQFRCRYAVFPCNSLILSKLIGQRNVRKTDRGTLL